MFNRIRCIWQATCFASSSRKLYSTIPGRKRVFFETYGCQMNVSDTEIAKSILMNAGYEEVSSPKECDTVLLMTCAVRESAESKIWARLRSLRIFAKQNHSILKIGVLGCMAERLKERLIRSPSTLSFDGSNARNKSAFSLGADFVCGPDAYRDLPRLIEDAHAGLLGASVALSLEETYADITPVRRCHHTSTTCREELGPCAFISVMRGCNNMCTYCIVPFVRGRERSRSLQTIVDEASWLFEKGVRELTLLGQNVNSYRDTTVSPLNIKDSVYSSKRTHLAPGFRTVYRSDNGGLRFADLLDHVSRVNPELRIRFTSPHPKDFPPEVLQLISERPNICSHLHLPAQSGSKAVLERMGRGYTPEAYWNLILTVRDNIPDVAITSDFIAGFCGETEDDHQQTLELIKKAGYSFCFCFPYSMREKTRAFHRLVDDVPAEVKSRRHTELMATARESSKNFNLAQVGRTQLVLIEGLSRRSSEYVYGRNDFNTKVIISRYIRTPTSDGTFTDTELLPGQYVAATIFGATSQTLHGCFLERSSISAFYASALGNPAKSTVCHSVS